MSVAVSVKMRNCGGSTQSGIIVRSGPAAGDPRYFVRVENLVALKLFRISGGATELVNHDITADPWPIDPLVFRTLTVHVTEAGGGTQFQVFIDGVSKFTFTDTLGGRPAGAHV